MWWDPASKRIMLFGGADPQHRTLADTWSWDGETWIEHRLTPTPPARRFAAVCGDASLGYSVLFGGEAGGHGTRLTALGDTWIWDGSRWKPAQPATRPKPNILPRLAYHSSSRQILLFNGAGREWSWTGRTWKKLNAAGSPNDNGLLVARPWRQDLLLMGAQADWAWGGKTWRRESTASPRPTTWQGAAVSSVRDRAILWYRPSLYAGEEWKQEAKSSWKLSNPGRFPTSTNAYAYDRDRDKLLAISPGLPFGNATPVETWELVESEWRRINTSGVGPVGKDGGRAVYDPVSQSVFYYSGLSGCWSLKDKKWTRISSDTRAGWPESLIYDEARRVVIAQANGWWEWSRPSGWQPPKRLGPTRGRNAWTMAYHPHLRASILLGGGPSGLPSNDCWAWDGVAWKQLTWPLKTDPLSGAKMTFHAQWKTIVVHGGYTGKGSTPSHKTWALTPRGFVALPLGHTRHGATGVPVALLDESRRGRLRVFHWGFNASQSWHWQLSHERLSASARISSGGQSTQLQFDAAEAASGLAVFLLSTGTHPGIQLPGRHDLIPLRFEPLLISSIGLNVSPIDRAGLSKYSFRWPRVPNLTGLRVHVAALGISPSARQQAVISNQVHVDLSR